MTDLETIETPPIVTREEWEAAAQQLLVKEKELTRARDAMAAARRRMPWLAGLIGTTVGLKEPPSHYSKRQCWVAADPDERSLLGTIDFVGADRLFWASDFPHFGHDDDYLENLAGLVEPLSEEKRRFYFALQDVRFSLKITRKGLRLRFLAAAAHGTRPSSLRPRM